MPNRILLRVDLNVPVSNGIILDETRIDKVIPTIQHFIEKGDSVVIASHFGRPKEVPDPNLSLEFLTSKLSQKLNQEVLFCNETIGKKAKTMTDNLKSGQVLLLENLRFYPGETKNDSDFAYELSKLSDHYVNDAFSCSHRAHASIDKITEFLPSSAGLLLTQELKSLSKYLTNPSHPMMAIIGGSKVSTKLDLLNNLIHKVEYLVIAGAMANTFLKAQGHEIGSSFYEEDLIDTAKNILSQTNSCQIILPKDVVVAEKIAANIENHIVNIDNVPKNQMILDIGPKSVLTINNLLKESRTIVMNGPLGVFELHPFSLGTTSVAQEIAKLTQSSNLISIAGGGDIVAALSQSNLTDKFTYISTAGGAFLEWLEGKDLPGLKALDI
jgi:phosphoglycerate kinase